MSTSTDKGTSTSTGTKPGSGTENEASMRNLRKTITGLVFSNANDKTITIKVERKIKHSVYGKFVKKTKKYRAHDEKNECNVGDRVMIAETRPLSKSKRWRLLEILEKAK